jgi:GNAT superfamily N-acetyltransferase
MTLIAADGALLDRILEQTYPVWHEGLSPHAYAQWNRAQLRLSWARERLQRFALVDSAGDVLASLKRYRFDARLDGRPIVMAGLGAVFTPPDRRGRGHATELIDRVLDQERRDGVECAGLFSEIGVQFYQRLGFVEVPIDEVTVGVRVKKGGTPAMLVRSGDVRDLPALSALHDTRSAAARYALRRSAEHIEFAVAKKRLFAGLSGAGTRQVEFFVAEEGVIAVAYAVFTQNQYGWTLEEAGDRDPAGARLGAMLQVLVAREPSQQPPLIRTWWPRSFAVPPQLELTDPAPARDVFMVRSLGDTPLTLTADDVFYWRGDYF